MNNFNYIASIYDALAKSVFGNSIDESTNHYLDQIKSDDTVLIVGGGTGKLLENLPHCKKVVFIEKSSRMLDRAKGRDIQIPTKFVHGDFLDQELSGFGVVICPFFLDCFNHENLKRVVSKIGNALSPDGKLIVTDFQKGTNDLLLVAMHLFFTVFANLESRKLKDIHSELLNHSFRPLREAFFYKNMIFSRVYGNL